MTTHPTTRVFAASIMANVPVLLWGNPGIGKTALIELWGAEWGYHVETVVGSNREATDFLGFPADKNGVTSYLSLAWAERLREAVKGILFLDELSTSAPTVQKAMLRVAQERYVGETKLPDTVAIVAAANPADVAVDGWDLAAPVANRFLHLDDRPHDSRPHDGRGLPQDST
jgi:MoxR-like ATPase